MRAVGDAQPGLSSLVRDGASYTDLNLTVSFMMESGDHPQGAGVVLDWRDAKNYQIIRYSLSENGWHLFTVHEGNRDKRSEATVPGTTNPAFGEWVTLSVQQKGGHVTAFHGPTKVLDYQLPASVSQGGQAGLFTRGNTVAYFDEYSAQPL